ncbi:MAG: M50 family metallopeptidase [Bacteroidales bacterium]
MSTTFLIVSLVLVAIFIRLKPFDLLFRTFNTLVHELSHAMVAIIFRQKVQKVLLNKNFSGACDTKIDNRTSMFFISVVGYIFPAVIGYLFVYMSMLNITSFPFYIILVVSIVALIFFIGNSFGRVWTLFFAGLNLVFILAPIFSPYYKHILYIYACILLIENLLSTLTLIYVTLITSKKSSDAKLLQKITKIPAIIWCLFFFSFAVTMLFLSINYIATTNM